MLAVSEWASVGCLGIDCIALCLGTGAEQVLVIPSVACQAGVEGRWTMAVLTHQLMMLLDVLWCGQFLTVGLYLRWVMLSSISHASSTVGPH
jgi:hypothetical protein